MRSRWGLAYAVEPHPAFFDTSGRDTPERRRDTAVGVHENVAIAPLVATLHGVGALPSTAPLRGALARLERARPGRADGIALARLLLAWSARWPDAAWDVAGPALETVARRGSGGIHVPPRAVRAPYGDRSGRPALVGARVSHDVHALFEDRGARAGASAGEVLELVGRAMLHGLTFAQLRERLAAHD